MQHTSRFLALLLTVWCASLVSAESRHRLADGWEHYQGSLGSTLEVWRGDAASDNIAWAAVTLPHCFNRRDALDPDVRYYQGPGWDRTRLKIANPFPGGRTLLHFDGSGQKSQVFVYTEKVGNHLGGYDEWDVDITDAAEKAKNNDAFKGEVPIAVMCDNSRDAEPAGVKQRKSVVLPAAGLHWKVKLNDGENKLRAVGKRTALR